MIIRTYDRLSTAPGPGMRKKSKKPLKECVCPLTKGVLIRVRRGSGQTRMTVSMRRKSAMTFGVGKGHAPVHKLSNTFQSSVRRDFLLWIPHWNSH
jgi:hypothetical protein